MHTTMVPEQVKTMKIQAGIQVSRPRELTRQLQLWKRFGRLYLIVFVLVRNIVIRLSSESWIGCLVDLRKSRGDLCPKDLVQTRGRVAAIRMSWEDFKILIREELCLDNEVQKLESEFWCHAMVRAGHAAYTDRFHELARMLTDEVAKTRDLKKNIEKRGNSRELSRDGKVKDYNKRSRTGRAFATTTSNPIKKEYSGTTPKCTICNYHHQPEIPCRLCTNCNRLGNLAKDCRADCLRLIRAPEQRSNRPNQALAIDGGQGSRNNGNQARGRAFMLGVEEAR
ncbi:hypothetical protein Tco_1060011 [Tanacetum coccineum]